MSLINKNSYTAVNSFDYTYINYGKHFALYICEVRMLKKVFFVIYVFVFLVGTLRANATTSNVSDRISFKANTSDCNQTIAGENHAINNLGNEFGIWLVGSVLHLNSKLSAETIKIPMNEKYDINRAEGSMAVSWSIQEGTYVLKIVDSNLQAYKNLEHIVSFEPKQKEKSLQVSWSILEESGWQSRTMCNYVAAN